MPKGCTNKPINGVCSNPEFPQLFHVRNTKEACCRRLPRRLEGPKLPAAIKKLAAREAYLAGAPMPPTPVSPPVFVSPPAVISSKAKGCQRKPTNGKCLDPDFTQLFRIRNTKELCCRRPPGSLLGPNLPAALKKLAAREAYLAGGPMPQAPVRKRASKTGRTIAPGQNPWIDFRRSYIDTYRASLAPGEKFSIANFSKAASIAYHAQGN